MARERMIVAEKENLFAHYSLFHVRHKTFFLYFDLIL